MQRGLTSGAGVHRKMRGRRVGAGKRGVEIEATDQGPQKVRFATNFLTEGRQKGLSL